MTDRERRFLTRYLADKAKSLYRENLAYKTLVQHLKEQGFQDLDLTLDSAKDSLPLESAAIAFERAIDARMPPSLEADEDQAWRKWIQDHGLDQGTRH